MYNDESLQDWANNLMGYDTVRSDSSCPQVVNEVEAMLFVIAFQDEDLTKIGPAMGCRVLFAPSVFSPFIGKEQIERNRPFDV